MIEERAKMEQDEVKFETVVSAATDYTMGPKLGIWRVLRHNWAALAGEQHEVKRVTLFDGYVSDVPENALEAVAWLNALIKKVPAKHRNAVVMDFCNNEYSCSLDVYYTIPLTPEQEAENKALEAAREAAERAQWEADERRVFESLKAKYGAGR